MAKINNTVQLLGNIGRDAEVKTTRGGKDYAVCTLATTDNYKDENGEWKSSTEWHNLTVFGNIVDKFAKDAKKGSLILVTGKITYNTYEKDGIKRTNTTIIVDNYMPLEKTVKNNPMPKEEPRPKHASFLNSGSDDDVPF